jgi:hypothetical protein
MRGARQTRLRQGFVGRDVCAAFEPNPRKTHYGRGPLCGRHGFVVRCLARSNRPIIAIALHRIASGLADTPLKRRLGLRLRGPGTGHMENPFFHKCAVQVVDTVIKRNLRKRQRHRDPITGDMIEVVQIDPAHGKVTELIESGSRFDMLQFGRLRHKCERHKTGESMRFILKFAKLPQMIYPMLDCFDMAEQHCAGASAPHVMPKPMDFLPFFCCLFASTNFVPDAGMKDLSAAAGEGVQTGVA